MPFSILEAVNLTCNCFFGKNKEPTEEEKLAEAKIRKEQAKKEELSLRLYDIARKHEIGILPVLDTYQVTNLFPINNHVNKWNIFIIGKDKVYILASINDFEGFPDTTGILNTNAMALLPESLQEFFDPVWDKTLLGRQLQFYMIYFGRTYFVNTYPFFNDDRMIIGAIMFIRSFEYLRIKDHNLDVLEEPVKKKISFDLSRENPVPQGVMNSAFYQPSNQPINQQLKSHPETIKE